MATYDEIIAASEANKNNYGMSQEEIAKRQELIRRVAEYNPDLAAVIARGPYRTNNSGGTPPSSSSSSSAPNASGSGSSGSGPNWKQGPSGPMSTNSPPPSGMGISDRTRGNPAPNMQSSPPPSGMGISDRTRGNASPPSQGGQPINININMPVDRPQDMGSSQPPNYGNQGPTQQPYGGGQWGPMNYLYNTMGNSLASAMGAPSPELQQQQGGNWREWMGPPPSGYDSSGWYTPQSQFQLTPEQEANRQSMYRGGQPQGQVGGMPFALPEPQGPSPYSPQLSQQWSRGGPPGFAGNAMWQGQRGAMQQLQAPPPEHTQEYWDNQFANDPQVRQRALQQGKSVPMYIPPYSGN